MYGLPTGFDSEVFLDCVLESVTFASNAIHLDFGVDHSITALKHLRYRVGPSADLRDDVLPVADSSLPSFVGRTVERTEVRLPGDLTLYFDGGGMLSVEDDSAHYESYSLKTPAGEVFV